MKLGSSTLSCQSPGLKMQAKSNPKGSTLQEKRKQLFCKKQASLIINCSPMKQNDANEIRFNEVMVPENATEKERKIHKFLDSFNIQPVNIESYLDDQSKLDSPEVRRLFEQRNSNISKLESNNNLSDSRSFSKLFMRRNQGKDNVDESTAEGNQHRQSYSPIRLASHTFSLKQRPNMSLVGVPRHNNSS